MDTQKTYSRQIRKEALRIGFGACGISRAEHLKEESVHLDNWLKQGMHAGMVYMEKNREKRLDPTKLVEGAKSVISVIMNYFPGQKQKDPSAPVVSKYAYGIDYHKVMKVKLNHLLDFIRVNIPDATGRTFVDSAPVMEHAWAQKSGLGWIGNNSLLLTKKYGSFVFIGELIVNAELDYDEPVKNMCENCRKCIDACPTKAIISAGIVDARKCISYHTIENKTEEMPEDMKGKFHNRVFGCDICQDVCPWNKNLLPHKTPEFNPKQEFLDMTREEWFQLSKDKYEALFIETPLERAGFEGVRRNLGFI